jgi:hypothetical protein
MQDLVRSGRYNREGGTDRREASGLTGWKEGAAAGAGADVKPEEGGQEAEWTRRERRSGSGAAQGRMGR